MRGHQIRNGEHHNQAPTFCYPRNRIFVQRVCAELRSQQRRYQAKHNHRAKFAFNGFGCTGENLSPEISWKNPPAGTKSFALMVHDPDAPTGGAGFWHWVVVDIPTTSSGLVQGAGIADGRALPPNAHQINTDFGTPGWGGPCPPAGDKPHRYNFTVYALKVEKLDLAPNATASLTGFMVNMNAIGKASFTGRYRR